MYNLFPFKKAKMKKERRMIEYVDRVSVRIIDHEEYMRLAANGARKLREVGRYRLLDGNRHINMDKNEISFFILDLQDGDMYEVDLKSFYSMIAWSLVGDQGSLEDHIRIWTNQASEEWKGVKIPSLFDGDYS